VPLPIGDIINTLLLVIAIVAAIYAPSLPSPSFVVLLASWALVFISVHPLAHRVVGAACGVRFLHYYLAPSSVANLHIPAISRLAGRVPLFGLRVVKESLKGLAPWRGWATYASGALASMLIPIFIVLYAYLLSEVLEAILLALLTAGNALFTLHYSVRGGDFWRAKKVKAQLESL